MSADNGIYIGVFPTERNDQSREYRVIEAQAIDNLDFFPDEETEKKFNGENPRSIVEYFGHAEVFHDLALAEKKAFSIEKEIADSYCPILEYGISTIRFAHPYSFYQAHAKEIVYKWDNQ